MWKWSRWCGALLAGLLLGVLLLAAGGCGGDDSTGPGNDPGPDITDFRLSLIDSFSVCRDETFDLTASLSPLPQSPDTTVLYSWLGGGPAGRLYLNYYTDYYSWTSPLPEAHFTADGWASTDTIFCTAGLQVNGREIVPVARDTIHVRVGHPGILDPGELHGDLVYTDENTRFSWNVYVIYPLAPGYSRYEYRGEGFDDPLYWGTGFVYIGPPYLYGSLVHEDEVWILLTGGSGPVDPDHPEAPAATLQEGLDRFDGGNFSIRPLCDPVK